MGDNNNTFIFSLPRCPKYLSPSARIWSPLELFVIHPGEGPRWEGPKLGSVWGFVFKALVLQKDGVINMKSLRSKHLQQLTARGKKKSCSSSTTHRKNTTNTAENNSLNANLPQNHHGSTEEYRRVYVDNDYCLKNEQKMNQCLMTSFISVLALN